MFQRIGEGTDVVTKEMYDFEDKGGRHIALRPEGTAPVARAFVEHRPPTPWKVWYATPGVPLRAAAGRPAPPAPPGRHRGIGSRRPRPRRRGDRLRRTRSCRRSGSGSGGWSSTSWARRPTGPPTPSVLAGLAARPRRRPGPGRRRPRSRSHPLRVLDSKRETTRAVLADAPRMADSPRRRVGGPRRAGAGRACARSGIDFELDPTPRARPRLLHPHALRVPERRRSATPSPRSSAAVATTASSSSSAARRRPASASAAASSASCSTCDAEGVFPAPDAAVDVLRGRRHRRRAPRSCSPQSCGPRASRADRAFDGRSMKAQMKAAGRSRRRLALIVGERGGRGRHRHRPRPATERADHVGSRRRRRPHEEGAGAVTEPMRTHRCGELRAEHAGAAVSRVRLGRPPPRARRAPRLHRPARPHRHRAVRRRRRRTTCAASSSCASPARCARGPRARSTPSWPPARSSWATAPSRSCQRGRAAAVPVDERADDVDETVRLRYRYLDLRRERMQRNLRIRATVNSAIRGAMERQGFVEVETPMLMPSDARGRPRVPRAVAPGARQLLRAAAVAAALQAAADGRRLRSLLPDRPLPPRRGPARRPAVRVHAARRRGELRHPGRGARRSSPRRCSTPPRRCSASAPARSRR